jgi:hypothetical protein
MRGHTAPSIGLADERAVVSRFACVSLHAADRLDIPSVNILPVVGQRRSSRRVLVALPEAVAVLGHRCCVIHEQQAL